MLSLAELRERVSAYCDGDVSFDDFADWYRRSSRGKFGADKEVLGACLRVDAALSGFYFDGEDEALLRRELGRSVRPFVPHESETASVRYEATLAVAVAATIVSVFAPAIVASYPARRVEMRANNVVGAEASYKGAASATEFRAVRLAEQRAES
jgi:hypothetical protein